MDVRELIDSGIIEMYCAGIASKEEILLVESMAKKHPEVRLEIDAVIEALNIYAESTDQLPERIREKIISQILKNEKDVNQISFPPRLSSSTTTSEWHQYISQNNLSAPRDFEMAHIINLPEDEKQSTYIAWAKKGAAVEESHDVDEYLFMLEGECELTIDGTKKIYKSGAFVIIPKNIIHTARAMSDNMILIGQLLAA